MLPKGEVNNTDPSDGKTPVAEAPTEQAIPDEAKEFVEAYGDMYSDPVATYYAEQAYMESSGGLSTTLNTTSEWVANYEFSDNIYSEQSELGGIGFIYLPVEDRTDSQLTAELLNNESLTSCIDRYMNLIARNPDTQLVSIIDNEFTKYCGRGSSDTANLLTTLKSVVTKHGSAANYSLAPAIYGEDDMTNTVVLDYQPDVIIDSRNSDNETLAFSSRVILRMNIDLYASDSTMSSIKESTDDISFSVMRPPESSPEDKRIVGIGQR